MSFFQNPFDQEFRVSAPFGDRQYSLTFSIPANKNRQNASIAWNFGPYDLSTYSTFDINVATDIEFKSYSKISINIAGATPAATTAHEVVAALNANDFFNDYFEAFVSESETNRGTFRILIKPKKFLRFYISNAGAEQILGFNKYAGVAELPTFFAEHTIENSYVGTQGLCAVIQLDPSDTVVDRPIITNAGFDYANMQADWQLLKGRVGLFNFQKTTVDGSDRITEVIEYPAGAIAGDVAKKTTYTYTGANKNPSKVTQVPYTLQSGDLVTP